MSDSHLSRIAGVALASGILFLSFAHASGSETPTAGAGPLFAVIPTLGIGGPLAILALLFPSLFGGVLVLFRQWGAYFAVISIVSLVYCAQMWWYDSLLSSWWGTQAALWLVITFVTLGGTVLAWRKNITQLKAAEQPQQASARTEMLVLWLLSVVCAGLFGYYALAAQRWSSLWALMLVLSIGLWAGTAYKLFRGLTARWSSSGDLPTEGVMLWTMLAGCIVLISWQASARTDAGKPVVTAILLERVDPYYGADAVASGMVLSSPVVAGEDVFVGLAEQDPQGNREKGMGALFCIDRKTNKTRWTFNDQGHMQPVFSSPSVSGDRVYIGEGFHYNPNCKLYCLDSKTGNKHWDFQTKSQVESTPCVAEGKVFVGAGNDGIYAFADADTRQEAWHFPGSSNEAATDKIVRFGASPVVADGRLFIGSGVDRENPAACETALFCLDAKNGELLWKKNWETLPCWAAAVVAGDRVYFALGNGDIYDDDANPAGVVLCLDVKTGDKIWRFPETGTLPNAVHTRPALDGHSIYFGSRDGYCYCLDRQTGKLRWKTKESMGSPVFASPALDVTDELNPKLFVVATGGRVCCLDARNGEVAWTFHDLEQRDVLLASSPAVAIVATPTGTQRRLYFGVFVKASNRPYLYCLDDQQPQP